MMFVSLYSLTHLVFAFMECELGRTWVEDSKKRQLSLIPALILTIMTICSLKWHFFFSVDAESVFQRGAFYGVIIPFVYIYIFLVTLRIFTMFPQKKYYALRGKLEKANKQAACPYDIGMSVGCAQFTKEVRTIPDLVSSADEDMYLRKEQKRTNL